jgi:hypothetical protein
MAACLFALAVAASACQKPPALSREEAIDLIQSSPAFQSVDPGTVFIGGEFRPSGDTKREILRLEGLVIKDDGPFAIAGRTATAAFTWRWTGGPYADRVLRSKAKLNCASGSWKVYDDYLKEQLWRSERGEAD